MVLHGIRGVVFFAITALTTVALAATPPSGTLNAPAAGQTASITWAGGPFTGATADPTACTTLTCDTYQLTVNVPATFYSSNPNYAVHVRADWSSSTNDFDLNVLDSAGNVVCSSGQGGTTRDGPGSITRRSAPRAKSRFRSTRATSTRSPGAPPGTNTTWPSAVRPTA